MLLSLAGVTKHFPGTLALDDVSLACAPGEVLALVGENGAGKSTLVKILAGAYAPDAGTIDLAGERVAAFTPARAQRLGISVIHQEFNLVPDMSVVANLFLGRERLTRGRRLDVARMTEDAARALAHIGAKVDPRAKVRYLSVAQQQLVEIARSLLHRSRLVVMDEPTAVLTGEEFENLLGVVTKLRDQGIGIIYVSHHLHEVFRVADRIAVLKDGRLVGTWRAGELDHDGLIRQMIGREMTRMFPAPTTPGTDAVLRVRHLSVGAKLRDVSFDLCRGEVLGIGGLVGSGRTTLGQAIFGLIRSTGAVEVLGRPRSRLRRAIASGMIFVPEDRKEAGLVMGKTARFNLTLPNLGSLTHLGVLQPRHEATLARTLAERVELPTAGLERDVALLSGGNQQKVVIGKWLARPPVVAVLDEPTRGIDVGAKAEIYSHIRSLATRGVAVLMISSDLIELIGMCDRILVLKDGALAGELDRRAATEEAIIRLATGAAA
jgi:ABC-type sugar transport system ATPase subunit